MDEYKSRLSTYLSDMVREELEKYDGGFTDEMNDQRGKNAEVLGYKLSGTSDVKEAKKPVSFKLGGVTFGKDYQGLKSRNGGIRYYYQKGTGSKNMESDFGKFIVKVGGLVSSSDKNKVAKKLKEGKNIGHYERVGNQTIVDSNFVNYSKGVLPNSELVHLGMGDFAVKSPKGTIEFHRSGKLNGIGQDFVGRPHRMTDDKNGKLVDAFLKLMLKKKKAILSMSESVVNERQFKGLDGIDDKTPLTKISDTQKLKIIQGTGNIISFFVPKGFNRNFWQVISKGKIKKGKSLSGKVVYTLPGKMIGSPQFKSIKDLIKGVDWVEVEEARRFNESVNEAKYKGYDWKRQNRKDGHPLIVPALQKTFANMKDLKKYIDKHGTMESVNEKISKEEWAQYPAYARKLKPYMQKLLKVPLKVRVIKQANHNPWIEVRVAKFGKDIIPNDFRVKVAKSIGASAVRDWDDVTYGTIRSNSIDLRYEQWVKIIGDLK